MERKRSADCEEQVDLRPFDRTLLNSVSCTERLLQVPQVELITARREPGHLLSNDNNGDGEHLRARQEGSSNHGPSNVRVSSRASEQRAYWLLCRLWATALTLLELSSTTGVLSPHVSSFLTSHVAQLQSLHDPFSRSKTSYAVIQSGKVELGGTTVELSKEEQNVVRNVADRFDLDELEALLAIRGLKKGKVERLEEDDWAFVTAHVFEERMGVIGCAALLFRCSESEGGSTRGPQANEAFVLQAKIRPTPVMSSRRSSSPPSRPPPSLRISFEHSRTGRSWRFLRQ